MSSASWPSPATLTTMPARLEQVERQLLVDRVVLDQQDARAAQARPGGRRRASSRRALRVGRARGSAPSAVAQASSRVDGVTGLVSSAPTVSCCSARRCSTSSRPKAVTISTTGAGVAQRVALDAAPRARPRRPCRASSSRAAQLVGRVAARRPAPPGCSASSPLGGGIGLQAQRARSCRRAPRAQRRCRRRPARARRAGRRRCTRRRLRCGARAAGRSAR